MLQPIKRRESGGGGATDAAKYVRRIEEKGEKGEPNLHALARSTGGYHRGCCLILSAVPRPFDHSSPHRRLIRSEFHILPSPALLKERTSRAESAAVIRFPGRRRHHRQ